MRALVPAHPIRVAGHAAVATAVVGASLVYASMHKDVTLNVDGHVSHVKSMSGDVSDILEAQDISVSSRDIVAPGPGTSLADGGTVVVRYARPLTVTVDGKKQTYWTTETSVDGALDALGVRSGGAAMSASRSQPIGRGGLSMWVSTPKKINFIVGGEKQKLISTAPTVGTLLTQQSVVLGPDDKLSAVPGAPLADGLTVKLTRIEKKQITRTEAVSFNTVKKKNAKLYVGQNKVITKGKAGTRSATYAVVLADGKVATRKLITAKTISRPVTQVMQVGTKAKPAVSANVGGSADSLNWAALARCESGGNPRAVNPAGYYGLYQFSLSTWRSVGGSGNPIDASSSEQTMRAKMLYNKAGAGQWGCGSHLYD